MRLRGCSREQPHGRRRRQQMCAHLRRPRCGMSQRSPGLPHGGGKTRSLRLRRQRLFAPVIFPQHFLWSIIKGHASSRCGAAIRCGWMSANRTKRTFRDVCYLSAFGGKADISQQLADNRDFMSTRPRSRDARRRLQTTLSWLTARQSISNSSPSTGGRA